MTETGSKARPKDGQFLCWTCAYDDAESYKAGRGICHDIVDALHHCMEGHDVRPVKTVSR